jgi:tRNA threonylcarbamoyl adenosine modification protein YjeE
MSIERLHFVLPAESDTLALGRRIAGTLQEGDTVALYGTLGAGKSTLARGIIGQFGREPNAASPTFNIIHEYDGNPILRHIDAYRLKQAEEFAQIGGEELIGSGICIIEWAEKIEEFIPRDAVCIRMEHAAMGRYADISGPSRIIEKLK